MEKIQQFINELQTIFKLLQQKSINNKVICITDLKEKMNQKISEIYKSYKESSEKIKNKIDGEFTSIIIIIDELIKTENDENIKVSELNQRINALNKIYKNKIENLNNFIKDHFSKLQYKLDNPINLSLADFSLFGMESEKKKFEHFNQ